MESSNSGPVLAKTLVNKFSFNKDLYESFVFLNNNKEVKNSFLRIFNLMRTF